MPRRILKESRAEDSTRFYSVSTAMPFKGQRKRFTRTKAAINEIKDIVLRFVKDETCGLSIRTMQHETSVQRRVLSWTYQRLFLDMFEQRNRLRLKCLASQTMRVRHATSMVYVW